MTEKEILIERLREAVIAMPKTSMLVEATAFAWGVPTRMTQAEYDRVLTDARHQLVAPVCPHCGTNTCARVLPGSLIQCKG